MIIVIQATLHLVFHQRREIRCRHPKKWAQRKDWSENISKNKHIKQTQPKILASVIQGKTRAELQKKTTWCPQYTETLWSNHWINSNRHRTVIESEPKQTTPYRKCIKVKNLLLLVVLKRGWNNLSSSSKNRRRATKISKIKWEI